MHPRPFSQGASPLSQRVCYDRVLSGIGWDRIFCCTVAAASMVEHAPATMLASLPAALTLIVLLLSLLLFSNLFSSPSSSRRPLIQLLPQGNPQLPPHPLQCLHILFVLPLILDLFPNPLKDPHSRRIVIHTARGLECGFDYFGGGDEVVGETVVEAALQLEEVFHAGEEGDVPGGEGFEGFVVV